MQPDLSIYYRRNLPHWLPPGATIFVTCRLAGTLPWAIRQALETQALLATRSEIASDEARIKERKRAFVRYDTWLDHDQSQAAWLQQPEVAAVVQESIHHYDGRAYALRAYCVMPNHVHLLLTIPPGLDRPFFRVLQAQKRYSATRANQLLKRTGPFWQAESYDHVVRNTREYAQIVHYMLQNPVKAGLVTDWSLWPYSYLAADHS